MISNSNPVLSHPCSSSQLGVICIANKPACYSITQWLIKAVNETGAGWTPVEPYPIPPYILTMPLISEHGFPTICVLLPSGGMTSSRPCFLSLLLVTWGETVPKALPKPRRKTSCFASIHQPCCRMKLGQFDMISFWQIRAVCSSSLCCFLGADD